MSSGNALGHRTRLLRWLACAWVLAAATAQAQAAAAPAPGAPPRWSQLADTVFQHLGQEQGLPGPIATAVAEDGQGFLWVGTQAGLARWDGYRFRNYKPDPAKPGSLPDNYVLALHRDPRGRLWIGTSAGGLARYRRESDDFQVVAAGDKGLSSAFVRSIADDGADGLWLATDGGLDHLAADGAISHERHRDSDPGSLPDDRIVALLRDSRGTLWIGTQKGLVRRDAGSTALVPVLLPTADGRVPSVGSFFEDRDGRLWIGTRGAGAYVIVRPGAPPRALLTPDAGLQNERVFGIAEARAGEIWIGTVSQGIVAVDVASMQTHAIAHDPSVPSSLSDNTVWALYRDRSGLVWAGTSRGLDRNDPAQTAVLTLFGASGRKRGLSDADAISVLPLADGRLWVGLGSNGVDILDPDSGAVTGLRPDPKRPESSLPDDRVLSLASAASGAIYLGTQRGLYRADPTGRSITRMQLPGRDAGTSVDVVYADGSTLWLGSWVDGLWQVDATVPGKERVLEHRAIDSFVDRRINAIVRGRGDVLWLGTANGLDRLDTRSGKLQHLLPDAADPSGLPTGSITSLLLDASGRLWVSTLGGGIAIMALPNAAAKPSFRRLGSKQGLPNENVNKLLADGARRIVASTDDGLAVIDSATLAVRALARADGVAIPAYWGASGAATAQGELAFGGGGGLTVVRPALLRQWPFRPAIVLTDVRVGGKPATAEKLTVSPEANSIAVEFSALDFSAPERNRYAYKLEGFDRNWIDSDSSRRLAAYTNLPPGRYHLLLRGSNREGAWSETELVLPIEVLPAWYQTLWFRVLELLALLLAVYLVVQLRTRTLRRRQLELEQKVIERTALLEAATDALQEASLTDPLTGLRNRRYLLQHIDSDIAASMRSHRDRSSPPEDADIIFLMLDVDHFKRINDLYGHDAGDAVLVQLSERLRQVFRGFDHVVRWGGEEFLGVARNTSHIRADALAERVRVNIAGAPFVLPDGQVLHNTCSIGYACFPFVPGRPELVSWQQLLVLADMALYTVKQSGRNGWMGVQAGPQLDPEKVGELLSAKLQTSMRAGLVLLPSKMDSNGSDPGLDNAQP